MTQKRHCSFIVMVARVRNRLFVSW